MGRKRRNIPAAAILVLTVLACQAIWCCGIVAMIAPGPGEDTVLVSTTVPPQLDCTALVEAVETIQADPYDESIPLDRELQTALRETCAANDVPLSLALGLIEVESGFDPEIVSPKGAYGLCQLNPKYFPNDLTPAENIRAGVGYLGELLERHGDPAAALRAYNLGWDDGDRRFASAVLTAAERWESVWK